MKVGSRGITTRPSTCTGRRGTWCAAVPIPCLQVSRYIACGTIVMCKADNVFLLHAVPCRVQSRGSEHQCHVSQLPQCIAGMRNAGASPALLETPIALGVQACSPVHGTNQWPSQRPSFDLALRQYLAQCLIVGQAIMRGAHSAM